MRQLRNHNPCKLPAGRLSDPPCLCTSHGPAPRVSRKRCSKAAQRVSSGPAGCSIAAMKSYSSSGSGAIAQSASATQTAHALFLQRSSGSNSLPTVQLHGVQQLRKVRCIGESSGSGCRTWPLRITSSPTCLRLAAPAHAAALIAPCCIKLQNPSTINASQQAGTLLKLMCMLSMQSLRCSAAKKSRDSWPLSPAKQSATLRFGCVRWDTNTPTGVGEAPAARAVMPSTDVLVQYKARNEPVSNVFATSLQRTSVVCFQLECNVNELRGMLVLFEACNNGCLRVCWSGSWTSCAQVESTALCARIEQPQTEPQCFWQISKLNLTLHILCLGAPSSRPKAEKVHGLWCDAAEQMRNLESMQFNGMDYNSHDPIPAL